MKLNHSSKVTGQSLEASLRTANRRIAWFRARMSPTQPIHLEIRSARPYISPE